MEVNAFPVAADPPTGKYADNPDCPEEAMFKHLGLAACEKRFYALNWPVKFPLVPPDAEFFHDSDIIIIADCAALVVDDIHSKYIGGSSAVMLCPRMQDISRIAGKLHDILTVSHPKSLTVLRMEVPCCNGLNAAAVQAFKLSRTGAAFIDIVVSLDGEEH